MRQMTTFYLGSALMFTKSQSTSRAMKNGTFAIAPFTWGDGEKWKFLGSFLCPTGITSRCNDNGVNDPPFVSPPDDGLSDPTISRRYAVNFKEKSGTISILTLILNTLNRVSRISSYNRLRSDQSWTKRFEFQLFRTSLLACLMKQIRSCIFLDHSVLRVVSFHEFNWVARN